MEERNVWSSRAQDISTTDFLTHSHTTVTKSVRKSGESFHNCCVIEVCTGMKSKTKADSVRPTGQMIRDALLSLLSTGKQVFCTSVIKEQYLSAYFLWNCCCNLAENSIPLFPDQLIGASMRKFVTLLLLFAQHVSGELNKEGKRTPVIFLSTNHIAFIIHDLIQTCGYHKHGWCKIYFF